MKYFLVIIAVSIFSACSFKPVSVGKVQDFKIDGISKDGMRVSVIIPIENKNWMGFKLTDGNLDFSLNNVKIGQLEQVSPLKIKARSNQVQTLNFKVKFQNPGFNILNMGWDLLRNQINISAVGDIKAKKCIFSKKFPISETRTIRASQLLGY